MNVGELNKGAVALIVLLLFGAGGYLWYSQMYKPAVAARAAALSAEQTAQSGLTAAKAQLATAQKALDDSKSAAAKPDDAVARLAKSRTSIPDKDQIDDASIVLMDLAARAGIDTDYKAGSSGDEAASDPGSGDSSLAGATPIDLEFKAAGTYAEMMQFMALVQSTAVEKNGKLYTKGRLFNVVKLEIGSNDDENSSGSSGLTTEGGGAGTGPILKPGDMLFTVTVRMYRSSTSNAESVGAATPDPAASATDASAGGATDSTAASAGGATDSTGGADASAGAADAGAGASSADTGTGSPGATAAGPIGGAS